MLGALGDAYIYKAFLNQLPTKWCHLAVYAQPAHSVINYERPVTFYTQQLPGEELLDDGPGVDVLDDGPGVDVLDDGPGVDVLDDGPGVDVLDDGPGVDVLDDGPEDGPEDEVVDDPGVDVENCSSREIELMRGRFDFAPSSDIVERLESLPWLWERSVVRESAFVFVFFFVFSLGSTKTEINL